MTTRNSPVIGVFDDRETAEQAINDLQDAGFGSNQISYASNVRSAGFLESIKHMITGNDAATNDLRNDLANMGFSQDEADFYAHEYEAGHPIVAVQPGQRMNEAATILRRSGSHDYRMRRSTDPTATTGYSQSTEYNRTTTADQAGEYRQGTASGQPGDYSQTPYEQTTTTTAQGAPSAQPTRGFIQSTPGSAQQAPGSVQRTNVTRPEDVVETDQERSLRLREEQLRAEKERVQTGEVQLHKEVVSEQQTIHVPVSHEEVFIERRAVPEGTPADDLPLGEGETIRVPVSEEQVHVTKTPMTTGEVTIEKREVEENREITDTVRREEARVEQKGDVPIHRTWNERNQTGQVNDVDDENV